MKGIQQHSTNILDNLTEHVQAFPKVNSSRTSLILIVTFLKKLTNPSHFYRIRFTDRVKIEFVENHVLFRVIHAS